MGKLTGVVLAGFLFLHVSEILNLISISTPQWLASNLTQVNSSTPQYNKGLWEFCQSGNCSALNQTAQATWFRATQALDVIGTGLGVLSLILTYVFLLATACRNSKGMVSTNAGLQIVAAGCLLAVIIIFGINGLQDVVDGEFPQTSALLNEWSFYVGIGGMVAMFLAAMATSREACYISSKKQEYENI